MTFYPKLPVEQGPFNDDIAPLRHTCRNPLTEQPVRVNPFYE